MSIIIGIVLVLLWYAVKEPAPTVEDYMEMVIQEAKQNAPKPNERFKVDLEEEEEDNGKDYRYNKHFNADL